MTKPIIRMSEAGKCPRALSAEILGYEAAELPAFVAIAANEGNWHEQRIKEELHGQGITVYDEQLVVKLDYPLFELVGHIDGKVTYSEEYTPLTDDQLLEIKSMSQYEFDRWMKGRFEAFPEYAAQITCYMAATKMEKCMYIVKNRSSGYEDRQVLNLLPMSLNLIIGNITEAVSCANKQKLAKGNFDLQSIQCKRCLYKDLCLPEPKELTIVQEVELAKAASDWRAGKKLLAEGQELVDGAKAVFEQHTKAIDTPQWQHSGLAVQFIHVKRESYEKKVLLELFKSEQLLPALSITEYDQIRVTDLQKENSNE